MKASTALAVLSACPLIRLGFAMPLLDVSGIVVRDLRSDQDVKRDPARTPERDIIKQDILSKRDFVVIPDSANGIIEVTKDDLPAPTVVPSVATITDKNDDAIKRNFILIPHNVDGIIAPIGSRSSLAATAAPFPDTPGQPIERGFIVIPHAVGGIIAPSKLISSPAATTTPFLDTSVQPIKRSIVDNFKRSEH